MHEWGAQPEQNEPGREASSMLNHLMYWIRGSSGAMGEALWITEARASVVRQKSFDMNLSLSTTLRLGSDG